jgi:alpha/beta superfamily hydrolase
MTPATERILAFGPQRSQVGVLTPAADGGTTGMAVIFINAGLIHHIGPHRLHVQAARALSGRGVASLRIDLSGIGDSAARADHLPIHELVRQEPIEAMDALAAEGFTRFALVGLCSGAYSAFHVACTDPRVMAAVMINPEDLSINSSADSHDQSAAWARRYWTHSVFRPRAWLNLLSGRVNYRRLLETLARQFKGPAGSDAPGASGGLRADMLLAVRSRPLKLLFLSSVDDVSREYLDLILDGDTVSQAPEGALQRQVMDDCDHLFTRLQDQRRLVALLLDWLAPPAA